MRTFEILFLIAIGISYSRYFSFKLRKLLPIPSLEILTLLLGVLHLILEGYRWQLAPGYALFSISLLVAWTLGRQSSTMNKSLWIRIAGLLVFSIFYIGSILLPSLLPIPRLSPPTGPYAVGTRSWHWIDENRSDPYAPGKDVARELMVQAWYPVDQNGEGERSLWMASAEIVAPAVAAWINLPTFFLDHLVHVRTEALQDAPITSRESGFPVILFSHGFGGFRAQNTNQMQHLASHGFVVIAVEHTYAAVVSVFPDGRIAQHNPNTLPKGLPEDEDLQATRALGDQWASDLSFILDQLSSDDHPSIDSSWLETLDLDSIGAFGHSTGGGAVIEFCHRDPRCDATLTLDPFLKPAAEETLTQGLNHDSLHMFSETWSSSENLDRFATFEKNSHVKPMVVSVQGTAHYDFSDLPLLSPLAHRLGLKGPINGQRMAAIVNAYLLAYFEHMLMDSPSQLLRPDNQIYPEVISLGPSSRP
jgi:predicted dienelactone hydrolase